MEESECAEAMQAPAIKKINTLPLIYSVDDAPAWGLSFLLGIQHYLTMVGGIISVPFILSPALCILDDDPSRGFIISSIFFVSGVSTLLQSTLGIRLPIVQGSSFTYITCSLAVLQLDQWSCPSQGDLFAMGEAQRTEEWWRRMRELQGAIIAASSVQILVGYCGLVGLMLRFITPLTIAPTITLVGLSLVSHSAELCAGNWYISITTIVFVTIFSQYLRRWSTPLVTYTLSKGWQVKWIKGFQLFPVLITTLLVYTLCWCLTRHEVLPFGDPARVDKNINMLEAAPWFRMPYPFQWGWPTFSASSVLAMIAAVMAGIVESVGDYYACARMCGKPPPPVSAMNRGVGVEGIGCVLAGMVGIGTGVTSFSENIGAIGVTRVASRKVVQCGAVLMVLLALFGKVGAVFATIPTPVVGGLLCVMFSVVTAVGLSNLQHVEMSSPRNLFVLGVSLFFGIALPEWLKKNSGIISTGVLPLDQLVTVLLSTHMFVGGFLGFFLDNTIPGSVAERGVLEWRKVSVPKLDPLLADPNAETYDLPRVMTKLTQPFKNLIRRPK